MIVVSDLATARRRGSTVRQICTDTIDKSNSQAKQLSLHLLSTAVVNLEMQIAPWRLDWWVTRVDKAHGKVT